jgi:hypothetical protein
MFFLQDFSLRILVKLVFSQNLLMPIVWLQLVVLKISTGFRPPNIIPEYMHLRYIFLKYMLS